MTGPKRTRRQLREAAAASIRKTPTEKIITAVVEGVVLALLSYPWPKQELPSNFEPGKCGNLIALGIPRCKLPKGHKGMCGL